jgi:MFS family permease
MYQVSGLLDWAAGLARPTTHLRRLVSANVLYLGLTSLFTDISSEMVVSVLPVYLVGFLRLSPAQFGVIDGLYQGVAGLMQLASGVAADRMRRYKEVAAAGYSASVLSRIGFLASTAPAALALFVMVDRLGKGIRTAPRDALISLSVPPQLLGTAFGVHRAMDAMGAMIGPIIAFLVLTAVPNGFAVVFVFSLASAIIGLTVLALFVDNSPARPQGPDSHPLSEAVRLLRVAPFRHLMVATLALGGMTISDGFVYLTMQRSAGLSAGAFPLLYVLTSASYLIFAIPLGRLADRVGRFPVFLAGHAVLIGLYGILVIGPSSVTIFAIALPLLGIYYAATEGVLMAVGSTLLTVDVRTTGLALLTTALAAARLTGSIIFGLSWARLGVETTIMIFLVGLATAIVIAVATRPRTA